MQDVILLDDRMTAGISSHQSQDSIHTKVSG